ncbi:class I SAM-dependent methyltransferase [Nonomuraea soli]|uniref:2-polyprenyl-3-methyl-5-hydroxy-6-metoxy-1, 4-benzoquinol methylase n=1 Tax=Nonomuraea soli TaxID=1032476 RepID=A0A7W0CTW1_9ACTN|nr:class I SAM-dependent methyltransferase [Nonomuraea soli]MBA2897272.1 2-polyprenyl-3-methyl-5-hydroxy-6-metoxy-1,4-benzoquinol methylase [Nonomuraea soli]
MSADPIPLGTEVFDRKLLIQDAWNLYIDAPKALRLKQRLRVLVCPFEEVVGFVPQGATVLDIGCGSGLSLGLMAARGRQITGHGFDPSDVAIGLAQKMTTHTAHTGSTLTYERRDARTEWPTGTYDVVSMQDVIHHVPVPHQRDVFAKACASVRPGGIFIYKDMSLRPRWRNFFCRLHDLIIAREWIYPIPVATIETWAAEHGLTVEIAKTAHRVVYGNDLRVFRKKS